MYQHEGYHCAKTILQPYVTPGTAPESAGACIEWGIISVFSIIIPTLFILPLRQLRDAGATKITTRPWKLPAQDVPAGLRRLDERHGGTNADGACRGLSTRRHLLKSGANFTRAIVGVNVVTAGGWLQGLLHRVQPAGAFGEPKRPLLR